MEYDRKPLMVTFPKLPDVSGIKDPAARAVIEQLIVIIRAQQEVIERLERENAELRKENSELRKENLKLKNENAELKKALYGKRSERMPPIEREITKKKASPEEIAQRRKVAAEKRKKNRKKKKEIETEDVIHETEENPVCPECGSTEFADINGGEESFEYEYIPGRFIRRRHIRKKKACKCGGCIITAPAPSRVSEGVQYGPGFHAHVVTSKCADSLPLNRQSNRMARQGVPISRSTLCDLFHRCAELLKPLWSEMIKRIARSIYVNADETPMPVFARIKTKRGYVWTFIDEYNVTYYFSATRSGETPIKVLGESTGFIQVDAYSGYNPICTPEKRKRIGCLGHVRRYFFAALETSPEEAKHAMDQILKLYQVEYDAAEKGILGTKEHLKKRQKTSAPIMEAWGKWLQEEEPKHLPESPIGKAIKYAINNWEYITVFLDDPKVRLDNNISEGHLRIAALGRKNWLFVGNERAGMNWAVLQSLVSTCRVHDVNPEQYLTEVLMRIQNHPQSRIEELLPQNWKNVFALPP